MKILFSLPLLIFNFLSNLHGQNHRPLSDILNQISTQWKLDSNSCNGYRYSVSKGVLNVKVDSATKDIILLKLGSPNKIQKFYNGNANKNYVSYIYYVYKDACPTIELNGIAVEFVFDEHERFLVEIIEVFYCG